jgi:hypothetical protein
MGNLLRRAKTNEKDTIIYGVVNSNDIHDSRSSFCGVE